MKLFVLSEGYYPENGGLEKIVTEIAEELSKTGNYEITVLTSTKRKEQMFRETINGVDVIYVPLCATHGKLQFAREIFYARKTLKAELEKGYDFVSIQYMGYFSAIFSSLNPKIPYSISIHGTDVTGQKGAVIKAIQRRIVQNASAVISNSYYLARALERRIGIPIQSKLKVIWNGIHLEDYQTVVQPTGEHIVISVGRFVHKKGFDVLIQAFEKVVRSCPDAQLMIAGDGVEREKCQQLAQKLGISDHIRFLGAVPNSSIADVYQMGRLFVCPSRNEAFGIVVLEAMAMGLPVIATDSGGVAEIIEDDKYGFLVPTEDADALAEKMLTLLHNDDLCLELRRKGLERVKEFSIKTVIRKYDEVIREKLGDFE